MASLCIICDSDLTNIATLNCNSCTAKMCLVCIFPTLKNVGLKTPAKLPQKLKEIAFHFNEQKGASFACPSCRDDPFSEISKKISSIENQVTSLVSIPTEKIESLKNVLTSLNEIPEIEKITGSIVTVEKSLSTLNENMESSWASIATKNCPTTASQAPAPSIEDSSYQRAISEAIRKSREQEKCDKALVIIGLREPSKDGTPCTEAEIQEEDKKSIAKMFEDIGLDYIQPERIYRLKRGKFANKSSPRKIKVVLTGHHDQRVILGEKNVLAAKEEWKKVYVEPSKPIDTRIAESTLRAQGRQMNKDHLGNEWKEKLDSSAIEMVQFRFGKLWICKKNAPGANKKWDRVREVETEELPTLPAKQESPSNSPKRERSHSAQEPNEDF